MHLILSFLVESIDPLYAEHLFVGIYDWHLVLRHLDKTNTHMQIQN